VLPERRGQVRRLPRDTEGRLRCDLAFANLQDFLPLPQTKLSLRALDLGSGTGVAALRLARLGIHTTLLDSSPAMLETAKRAHGRQELRTSSYCIMGTLRGFTLQRSM